MRFLMTLAAAALAAGPALAQGKLGTPPPSPELERDMRRVLARAQPELGSEISPGMTLTAATSQGNTIVFMTRAKDLDSVEIGMDQTQGLSLQQRFVKTFGRKFCRNGSGSRRFIDAGGRISIAATDRRRKLLVGGTLTKC